jgi:hypothetical protein
VLRPQLSTQASQLFYGQLLRQEKDEASPFRVCGPGFTECLHSLFCRDEGFFVVTVRSRPRSRPRFRLSRFEDENEDEEDIKTAHSRSGLSIINPLHEKFFVALLKDQSMAKNGSGFLRFTFLLAVLALCRTSGGATFSEDFSTDPFQNGWQAFGNTNLFRWDSINHNVAVTWDSSQSNSYFYHPLGTTLGKADAFSVDFDIQLNSLEWTKTFQLAVGLLNFSSATNSGFSRPLGTSPDIFEFDYFPDSGDGFGDPNLEALMTDHTSDASQYPNFYFIYDNLPMNLGTNYHVTLTHGAGDGSISATVLTNGVVYTTMPISYQGAIGEFRLDTISISSYSGAGQDPQYAGSILAQGTVDNFVVTLPPLARNLAGGFTNSVWQTQFNTYTNVHYALQRSTNLITWSDVTDSVQGTGGALTLSDTNAMGDKAYYRVRASQP